MTQTDFCLDLVCGVAVILRDVRRSTSARKLHQQYLQVIAAELSPPAGIERDQKTLRTRWQW